MKTTNLSRRAVLQGVSVSMAWTATAPLMSAYGHPLSFTQSAMEKRVVIYAEAAHFSDHPALTSYAPPASHAGSTRQYVESLTEQEFLTRHWFV